MASNLQDVLNDTQWLKAKWIVDFKNLKAEAEKDEGHVNALKFKGVLLLLDEPSNKPPNGSHGHRILIPTKVAKDNIKTLIGMGVDYENTLDKHNPKKKVGVIQKAWIEGNKLWCSGILWKKDFPDIEDAIKDKQLGMSFEGSNITIEDPKADVWKLTDVCFTGAALLYKTAAAYQKTEALAAAADRSAYCAELVYIRNGGKAMSQKKAKDKTNHSRRNVSAAGVLDEKVLAKALQIALKPLVASQQASVAAMAAMSASFEEFQNEQLELIANGAPGMLGKGKKGKGSSASSASSSQSAAASSQSASSESAAKESGGLMKARGKKKGKASGSSASSESAAASSASSESAAASSQKAGASSSAADDAGSLEDMDESDSINSSSEAPGHLNKRANENKGNKNTVSTQHDHHPKAEAGLHAAAEGKKYRKTLRKLLAGMEELKAENKKLRRKSKELQAQAEAAYEDTERKSIAQVSPKLAGLLAKGQLDISTLAASGEKMSVNEFDAVLDKVPSLDSKERIALKAEAARAGIMDEGIVSR